RRLSDVLLAVNPDVRVAATRKTTPGFRYYEKKALEIGGGEPHRQGLYDMILIKDNHISVLGSITEAVKLARANSKLVVEVEADTLEQAREAASAGADIVMLDNMTPEMASEGYSAVKAIDPNIMVEVSGGITPENIILYARCADRVSMSRITSYSKPVDFTFHMV
ncbi:MAG: carboxylating.nicotinate-nucleotide diphosphorylase, partial [Candidatus Thermoplasmatota archaeon]|nr:carboxylating.nicotinate-nucleotide diphosphorylase [Candidatus Thermoplasmatota archaeon]